MDFYQDWSNYYRTSAKIGQIIIALVSNMAPPWGSLVLHRLVKINTLKIFLSIGHEWCPSTKTSNYFDRMINMATRGCCLFSVYMYRQRTMKTLSLIKSGERYRTIMVLLLSISKPFHFEKMGRIMARLCPSVRPFFVWPILRLHSILI